MTSQENNVYICKNCKLVFNSKTSYLVHSTPDRPACAYEINEYVKPIGEFTLQNVWRAAKNSITDEFIPNCVKKI